MVAVHRQPAIRTLRLINIPRPLQRLAQSRRELLFQLGFQLMQQPPDGHLKNLPAAPIVQPNHLNRNATEHGTRVDLSVLL